MKISWDIIFLIAIGLIILFCYCSCNNNENFENIANADIEAIRNLNGIAAKLVAGGLTVPGSVAISDNVSVNNNTNEGGRVRIMNGKKTAKGQTNDWSLWNMTGQYGDKLSFWRYNGDGANAGSAMDIFDNGNVNITGGVSTNSNIANGWISGSFGSDGKDRVVIGNLENQATVGAHNNALNAWTALRLQGDSINMVPNNGIINFPNGWRIHAGDHFRIQHNGVDKLVAHRDGLPVYSPNGMDVGTWKGTGGGTLNVSGDVFMGGSTLGFNNREHNIVASGGYFHMTGPNNRGSKEVAARNFIGWGGW